MPPPDRLGRLRRVGVLGTGGFATVWHYRDEELGSDVAVKVLADNWARQHDVRARFVEEARILRRCDSDHVVRVHDIGETDGAPYFVMTYADGGSLADLVGRPNDPGRVVELVRQAAEGLSVLHRNGILHRDLKPQNLLLRSTPEGGERLLVADLGVAKEIAHASGLTQLVGTPAYMAPEQAARMPLDARTDVHALGAVAYTLLTGRLLHDPERPGVPAAPAQSLVSLPPGVGEAVMRAAADDPDERFGSAAEFGAALRTAYDGGAGCARRPEGGGGVGVGAGAAGAGAARPAAVLPVVLVALLVLVGSFVAAYAVVSALR